MKSAGAGVVLGLLLVLVVIIVGAFLGYDGEHPLPEPTPSRNCEILDCRSPIIVPQRSQK